MGRGRGSDRTAKVELDDRGVAHQHLGEADGRRLVDVVLPDVHLWRPVSALSMAAGLDMSGCSLQRRVFYGGGGG
eukprot:scaffold21783_cov124-Isochrysis_galbana.AAC.1